jgi:hypothetical protein
LIGQKEGSMWFKNISVLLALLLMPVWSWAAHPLITDDADTQGKGKSQVEINGQYDFDEQTISGLNVKSRGGQAVSILSYGLIDNTDIVIGIPYVSETQKNDGLKVNDQQGFSDLTVELKWRFYEKDGLNLALKPSISIPTGNDEKGLGAGKTGYAAFFILSKELEPWAGHVNLGYIRNDGHQKAVDCGEYRCRGKPREDIRQESGLCSRRGYLFPHGVL